LKDALVFPIKFFWELRKEVSQQERRDGKSEMPPPVSHNKKINHDAFLCIAMPDMKKFTLSLIAASMLCGSAFAKDQGHLEIGTIISNGVRISCVYHIWKGHDSEVHLVFPDGSDIQVTVAAGTSTAAMDKSLRQIADKYTAPR
jgi:hypothetical protein